MKEQTKAIILNVASELFYTRGYNLTGINEIIEKSGIAKSTLYSHFKSKEELMIAYLIRKDEELLLNIKAYCKEAPSGDAQLRAVIQFLIPFFEHDNFNGCWCIRSVAEIPKDNLKIRTTIQANKQAFLRFIQGLVFENKTDMSATAQHQLAKRIYLLYESAVTESHLHNALWPIHESLELLDLILAKK